MKKILSIVFAALLACLAALCVVGVGKGFLDSTIDAVSPISEASSESNWTILHKHILKNPQCASTAWLNT